MRRLLPSAGLVLACLPLACPSATAEEFYLVKDGAPQGRILLPRAFGKATLLGAHELADYVEKMTGARLPIDLGKPHHRVPGTYVVLEPKIDPTKEVSADGTEDIFTIQQRRNALTITGNSDAATLYGVYQYLHELGVRWYMPGEIGENVPKLKDLKIGSRSKIYKPSFRTREIDYSGYNETHFHPKAQARQHREWDLWLLRNKVHFVRSIHWGHLHRYDFNWTRENSFHNLHFIIKPLDLEKSPERFPLITRGGETKRCKDRVQICFTHPENIRTAIDGALKYFEKDPWKLTFPLSLNDWGGICECANCTKANGGVFPPRDPNRVVWKFMNAVAEGLTAKLPNKRIAFFTCYGGMTCPPEDIQVAKGIVGVSCHVCSNSTDITDPGCPFNRRYYDWIRRAGATGAEQGCYDYSMFGGTPQPLTILNSIKTYHDLGYVWYHTESMGRDEQRKIVLWAQAQLAWNVNQDPAQLLKTFCEDYYGAAGDDVLAVLNIIEAGCRKMPKIIIGSLGVAQSIMTDDVIEAGLKRLESAAGKVRGREKERLERFSGTFVMLSMRATIGRVFFLAQEERSEASKSAVTYACQRFEDNWDHCDLSETCSPTILAGIARLKRAAEAISAEVTPSASKELADADQPTILKELFSFSKVPDKIENLFLLPELWRFRVDITREGEAQGWMKPDFDDSKWHTLSTWNYYERQGFDQYDGAFWYRVRFKAPTFPEGKKVFLRIGALDDEGKIYLNGKLAHQRWHLNPDDWQSSFEVEVTDFLRPGKENVIAVYGNDEYGVGGIWKPCALYTR